MLAAGGGGRGGAGRGGRGSGIAGAGWPVAFLEFLGLRFGIWVRLILGAGLDREVGFRVPVLAIGTEAVPVFHFPRNTVFRIGSGKQNSSIPGTLGSRTLVFPEK